MESVPLCSQRIQGALCMLVSKLQQPKATRPVTAKTLSSTIATFFHKQLSDEEIKAVAGAMQELGFLKVVDGKVTCTTSR